MSFWLKHKSTDDGKQKNFCGGCNCSCTCDRGCNGDVEKCTSKKALEKKCSHCCECYMDMLTKRLCAELDAEKKNS